MTDQKTGLMWQKGEPGVMTWGGALSYCEGLTLAGNSDWRLPNSKELESIKNDVRYDPAIDTSFFPNAYTNYYWSSTTHAEFPGYAWSVGFDGKGNGVYVRCVRAGQVELFYNLVISKAGTGSGTVTSDPVGIDCGGTCDADFAENTEVTLTATSATGSTFDGWSVDCDSSGQVTMIANKTCTATFALNTYTIAVNPSGTVSAGQTVTITSDAGGVNCTWNGSAQGGTCTSSAINHGSSVTLTAALPTGTTINWGTGCNASTATTCTISSLTANTTISPVTTVATYTVTTTANNGTITSTNNPTVNHGSTTIVTGTANANYYFTGVSGCGGTTQSNTDQSVTTFSYTTGAITTNCTVTATFAIKTYTVTPSAGAGGIINPSTPQTVNHGATTQFTVTPNAGYIALVGGTCGGSLVGNTYTTSPIIANCTVAATFTLNSIPDDPPPPLPSDIIYYYYDPAIQYTGGWMVTTPYPCGYQVMAGHNIGGTDTSMSLNFTGTSIRWHTMTSPQGGWARVYIDGQLAGRVSLYSDITQCDVEVFRYNLSSGNHTIRIAPEQSLPGIMINIYRFVVGLF